MTQEIMAMPQLFPSATPTARSAKLGVTYKKTQTTFRVWAPTQRSVTLCLYEEPEGVCVRQIMMHRFEDLFEVTLPGDLDGMFYTYRVGEVEVTDPYSVASSQNGEKSAIVDLASTDPQGFREERFQKVPTDDAVVYELHIGDFTFDRSSGVAHRGKYLSFSESGTLVDGLSTGIDHLKELGVTHVHLMPVSENATVDEDPERFGDADNYNWGYDVELYNVPEGSYATDSYHPKVRIREFKEMVQAFHQAGIAVILDVVYNHTFKTYDSNFNVLVPNYYYRQKGGTFSNGSGVGNELATERPMVRKFVLESLRYWQREYHVDGFRFDLMALIDLDTITQAMAELKEEDPDVLVYGEPWYGAETALPNNLRTLWSTQNERGFGLFNEAFRNALRGDNDGVTHGYIQGNPNQKMAVETGLLGSIDYPSLHNGGVKDPINTINYFNAHDNLILEDKLTKSVGNKERNDAMTRLAFGILLTAQGIPFFHAGNEFRRSKKMDANSYHSPYTINGIDWHKKREHRAFFQYVCDLIALRKEFDVFTLRSHAEVKKRIHVVEMTQPNLIAMLDNLDTERKDYLLCLYYNGWQKLTMDVSLLFQALEANDLTIQRIFDRHGRVESNRVRLYRSERIRFDMEPISMIIFRVKVNDR